MKQLIIGIALATTVLAGCRQGDQRTPTTPPPTPTNPGRPNPVVNCREFNDFIVDYQAMKPSASLLEEIPDKADRLTVASSLLVSQLISQYPVALAMQARGREALKTYINYFYWIFTGDGHFRAIPNHPLTSNCYRR